MSSKPFPYYGGKKDLRSIVLEARRGPPPAVCGRGTVCQWMQSAASRGTVFQWQKGHIDGERFLVVKMCGLDTRMVAACPVCGGRPKADGGSQ